MASNVRAAAYAIAVAFMVEALVHQAMIDAKDKLRGPKPEQTSDEQTDRN